MTALTADALPATRRPESGCLTFGGLLRSEWIKLFSLRSTWWTLTFTVIVMMLMGVMIAASVSSFDGGSPFTGAEVATFGFRFAQIPVAVLGAMIITGEFSSGMIRSTMTAAPRRTGAIGAKVLVLAAVTFVVGVVGSLLTWLVTTPMLASVDATASLSDGQTWRIILGCGAYLAGIALLAFGLGLIVRNTAGSIATVLTVVLLLPMIVSIAGAFIEWVRSVAPFLPDVAGGEIMRPLRPGDSIWPETGVSMLAGPVGESLQLGPIVGAAVFFGYVAIVLLIGITLTKKRDI